MSRTATLVWDVGSLWDPFRALAERAARSGTLHVRVPIYKWPDQATVYSLLQLYRSLSQANGSVPPATTAALALVAAPLLIPRGVSLREFGLSPRGVVEDRELWRLAVPTFLHIDMDHALSNASSLLQTGTKRERHVGTRQYVKDLAVLTVLSNSLYVAYAWLLCRFGVGRERYYFGCALGASGLCFAQQVVADSEAGGEVELTLPWQVLMDSEVGGEVDMTLPLTGVRLARCYLPWVNLALTQVLVPRASLAGHLCGIAAGLIYSGGLAPVKRALARAGGWRLDAVRQRFQRAAQQRLYGGGRNEGLDGRPLARRVGRPRPGPGSERDRALPVQLMLLGAGFAVDIALALFQAGRRQPRRRTRVSKAACARCSQ